MTFVDTNVIIDVLQDDPVWAEWSMTKLADLASEGPATINAVVIAELSPTFQTLEALLEKLEETALGVAPIEEDAAFLAGKVYARYRRERGDVAQPRVLPDFLIGAHAMVLGLPLLTRDPALYRRYFPELELITPEDKHG